MLSKARLVVLTYLTPSFLKLCAITIFIFFIAGVKLHLRARARPMRTQNALMV